MNGGVYDLGIFDWALFFVYFFLLFLLVVAYKGFKVSQEIYKRFFISGFLIKVVGSMAFALLFIYYYGFGDTFLYHKGATILSEALAQDPVTYFRLLFSEHGNLPPDLQEYAARISYSRTQEEWFMVKLTSMFNFISFGSYVITTLFMSLISFFGSWKLFQVMADIFPEKKKVCFYIVFLLPSVLFWGGGILKDTISMAAINLLIYTTYFMIYKRQYQRKHFFYLLVGIFFLLNLKLYILLSFLPAMALGIYNNFKNRINSEVISFALRPFLVLTIAASSYFITTFLGDVNKKYAVDNLEEQAKGFHTWHVTTAGSAYTLGEIEYTPLGVLKKVPAALNVTFFRPYLWESRNPIMLIGAAESAFLLLLTIYALWLWGFKIFKAISSNSLLVTLLIFILIFGFAVGFTSYNFGALARYKIPITSLIFFVVYYLIYQKRTIDQASRV
ncbi:hypothetical protein K6119_16000 [Paracrocinitomix mangrovi]|uniref:hypothetical protein n=1 Tax=Paracrocinitomix mangrovi TaxID=2862509 RepID=UPI001C8E2421|nr:hypothetical protein [Paracrocinitomix mangrovi]UKN01232.1 hypothetical protein K6119_16000 [Paracrocinitomix mangrovi]